MTLKQTESSLVCFVCTVNICRSAFAEGYCLEELQRAGLSDKYSVISTGIRATTGYPATPDIIDVAKEYEVDLSNHRSKTLASLPISACRFILTMEEHHRREIERLYPEVVGKVYLLRNFATHGAKKRDITDPMGLSPDFLRACFDDIVESINGFVIKIQQT